MDDKELIWVDKDFAEKWKIITNEKNKREEREKVFDEYLKGVTEEIQKDFECVLDGLEEDAAIFTGMMLKTKQSFEKAKNEHLEASYELWDKFEKEIPSTKEKTEKLLQVLTPIKGELTAIDSLLSKINTYNLDKFIESLSLLSGAYGKNKEMIEFLVKHFGEEKPNG